MPLTKKEVQEIFNNYYVVDPPKHVFMLEKPTITFSKEGHFSFFKGLQPKWRRDVIILTPDADDETVIHEALHANYETEEFITSRLGKLMVLKHRFLRKLNRGSLRKRDVRYIECKGCNLCSNLKELLIHPPLKARPKHWILKQTF